LRNLRKHHASQTIAGIEAHCGDMSRAYLGAPAGVHVAHPYFDLIFPAKNVRASVRFSFAVPRRLPG
jgi:hypothetical protein